MTRFKTLALSAVALACTGMANAADFVLQASSWGAAQNAAVAAAGGTVKFSHGDGLAVVSSDRADFLAAVLAGGAVRSGAADMAIKPSLPTRVVDAGAIDAASITDGFYQFIQWAPQAVKAPQAWAAGYTGKGVRVAVIDGGIHGTHVDLVGNIDAAAGRSFVPPSATATPAENACRTAWNCDTGNFWHGTHVAGIVAAAANGRGTVGIAPEATIVPVKALHNGGGSFGSILSAMLYAATDGRADIINMSLGATVPKGGREAAELLSALNRAASLAARQGVLVVASAGNDTADLDHNKNLIKVPAEVSSILSISATGPLGYAYNANNFGRFASYSNYGSSGVTLAAPGGDDAYLGNENCTMYLSDGITPLVRPCWVFDMVMSTTRGTGASTTTYGWAAGTSMASPAAAAVAAMIEQKYPGISVGDLKNRLRRATDDLGKPGQDPFYGAGFLNAAKAVAD